MAHDVGTFIALASCLGIGLVSYLATERKRGGGMPDSVNRSVPPSVPLELLSGCMDTITIIMRSVGMAVILCGGEGVEMEKMAGVVLKHILVGHLVAQVATLVFSNYETPMCTPSIEVLPLIRQMVSVIPKHAKDPHGHDIFAKEQVGTVVATMLLCSSCVSFLSGLFMYAIGLVGLGKSLRFMPFAVEVSVQSMLGLLLLSLGIESSCGVSILENLVENPAEVGELFSLTKLFLWLPAIASGLGIYLFTNFVKDTPFNIAIYIASAMLLFHGICLAFGISLDAARNADWLFPNTEHPPVWELYTLYSEDVVWSAVFDNLSGVCTCVFMISIINIACQLAVTPSLLPPDIMGTSTFDYEMIVQGRSHIFCGLSIGFPSDIGNDDSLVHRMLGGKFRLSMWAHVVSLALCILIIQIPSWTVPFIPRFINGAVVLLAAIEFLVAGFITGRSQLSRGEYNVVLASAAAILLSGGAVVGGLLVGTFCGLLNFTMGFAEATEKLRHVSISSDIVLVQLPTYICFATAHAVLDDVVKLSQDTQCLIVDFSHLFDMDTKAAFEFARLCSGTEVGCKVYLAAVNFRCIRKLIAAKALPPGGLATGTALDEVQEVELTRVTSHRTTDVEPLTINPDLELRPPGPNQPQDRRLSATGPAEELAPGASGRSNGSQPLVDPPTSFASAPDHPPRKSMRTTRFAKVATTLFYVPCENSDVMAYPHVSTTVEQAIKEAQQAVQIAREEDEVKLVIQSETPGSWRR